MGAKISRSNLREITIEGVEKLHGENLRLALIEMKLSRLPLEAILTKGDVFVSQVKISDLKEFLEKLDEAGAGYEEKDGVCDFSLKEI